MDITEIIKRIDFSASQNKQIACAFFADFLEYMMRVEAHIYMGNEIRADLFMGFSEKQEEIKTLDRKRTQAHDKMLSSFTSFLGLLRMVPDFHENVYKIGNRTQIADFVALIAFELLGKKPTSRLEGSVRDELAEMLHKHETSYEEIMQKCLEEMCNLEIPENIRTEIVTKHVLITHEKAFRQLAK